LANLLYLLHTRYFAARDSLRSYTPYCKTQENNCKTITKEFKAQLEEKDKRIKELQNNNEILIKQLEKKEPDLQLVRIKDLQEYNETLKKELEDYKQMHNNYMLQVQTIINQKAIEAQRTQKPFWKFW